MSQEERILQYLREHGEITPLEALQHIGCLRLSARISDLREQGYDITTNMVTTTGKEGEPKRYAAYKLNESTGNERRLLPD